MKHLGDICKINGAEIEPVWCITGGSPCQDLSIAGKRAGLAGARSGLFMEQVRITREMREEDRKNGRTGEFIRPRYLVWENVPGAFSSNKGRDFAAVLEEIIRIAEPEAPSIDVPAKGWPTWGGYHDCMGGGWSVAWRVHDAQYWGVPQRRRRISLVADFGGDTAGEILFERKGVPGNFEESRTAGEGITRTAENYFNQTITALTNRGMVSGKYAETLRAESHGAIPMVACTGFKAGQGVRAGGIGYSEECSPTLSAAPSGTNQVPAVFALQECIITSGENAKQWGDGIAEDVMFTLTARDVHGVALDMAHACDVIRECGEQVPALQARMGTGGNQVPLTFQMNGFGDYRAAEVASSCKQRDFKDGTDLVCSSVDCRNFREGGEVNGTLQAKESGGQSLNTNNTVRQNMVVRRLTPMECERLQGFPDYWTDIGEWTDEKGKKHKDADSPRYKALGNSIALPFWEWMLRRMARYLPEGATLGSLFDGIGGFPLIWERIHGEGTARWASEIEQFPIAVTKIRFPEEE